MTLFSLLTVWLMWQMPEPAYGPRPLVSPVMNGSAQQVLFVRESWRGDELWLRDMDGTDKADKAGATVSDGDAVRLWAAGDRVIDGLYWSGDNAVVVQAHGPARAPALWWVAWGQGDAEAPRDGDAEPLAKPAADGRLAAAVVPVRVRRLTPESWPEGERRGAQVVDVRSDGGVLLSLDRRLPYQSDLYRWSPRRQQPRVVEVNPGNVLNWRSDAQGTPRLRQRYRLSRDNIEYIWEWRQQAYGAWTRAGAWHLDEPAWRPLRFNGRDDLWVYAETDQRDTLGLHPLALLGGALGAPAVSSSVADVSRVWWSADAQQPALVEWHSLLPGQRALRPAWRRWQQQLHHHAADSHWLIRQVNERQSRLLVTEIDGRRPQRWWHYASDTDTLRWLGREWPQPAVQQAVPELRPLRWTSSDGLMLTAYFQPAMATAAAEGGAEQSTQRPAPLLVLVHGGPWSRDRYNYDPLSAALARAGIAVLKVNYRGSSGYGRDFLMASRGEWGKAMQRDVFEGIEQVTRRGWADPQRACIAGMSYGGYAALHAVLSHPQRFRCALAHAPVTDIAYHIRWLAQRGDTLGAAEWRAMVGDPDTQSTPLREISPLHRAQSLSRDVLLSHSKNDGVVPAWHSLQFLAQAPRQWVHWVAVDGGHRLERAAERQQLWSIWQRFIVRELLPAP